jgi:flagellar biosynthesis protein FliR
MNLQHFPALVIFAFLVSVVFGVLTKTTPRAQALYALKSFCLFVGIALLLGWMMYPFPR